MYPSLYDIFIVSKLDNPNSESVRSITNDIEHWARVKGVNIIAHASDATNQTLFVAIGGDGTVIYAAKEALQYDAAVLGFNIGKVGFLADFDALHVFESLTAAFTGSLKEEQRTTIEIEFDGVKYNALNDIVVSCSQSDSTLTYELMVSDEFAGRHTANGVIISTPTGSTAYALSVGGAIIIPSLDVMEVVPIAAQTLTSRPLIVPSTPGIAIKFSYSSRRPVTVRVDGSSAREFTSEFPESTFHTLTIGTGSRKVRLLHHYSWNHFDVLTKKLFWNK